MSGRSMTQHQFLNLTHLKIQQGSEYRTFKYRKLRKPDILVRFSNGLLAQVVLYIKQFFILNIKRPRLKRPFEIRMQTIQNPNAIRNPDKVYHSKSGHVRFSDPHCSQNLNVVAPKTVHGCLPDEGSDLSGESGSALTGESGSDLTGDVGSSLTGDVGSHLIVANVLIRLSIARPSSRTLDFLMVPELILSSKPSMQPFTNA